MQHKLERTVDLGAMEIPKQEIFDRPQHPKYHSPTTGAWPRVRM